MAIQLKQSLKITQSLLITPQLQQAIKLLQLSRVELESFVSQQIAENPVIDESYESEPKKASSQEESDGLSAKNTDDLFENPKANNLSESLDIPQMYSHRHSNIKSKDEYINYENFISENKNLQDFVSSQLCELDFDKNEEEIANELVGNISDAGYLDLDIEELAKKRGVNIEIVEGVLDEIQRLDPSGVGARDLRECLRIQLRDLRLKNGIVENIVAHHLKDVELKKYKEIAKSLGICVEEVVENISIIVGLEPNPGRQFGGIIAQSVIPDVYVYEMSGKWVVSLNEDNIPNIKINPVYVDMKSQSKKGKARSFLKEKINSANWLIKSLLQRQETILKVTESIVRKQSLFLEKGVRHLIPMILKDVAEEVSMHESTISRVTSNKYIHTPQGIFELKFFFSSPIKAEGLSVSSVSSVSVKSFIKEILMKEDPKKPYSDQKIVDLLERNKIYLARRTVAKYREQMGVLSSSRRKKLY